jgi:hypothetical protein
MASFHSGMLTLQLWLMSSGKLEAVQTGQRGKIGSMPPKPCAPALTRVDHVPGTAGVQAVASEGNPIQPINGQTEYDLIRTPGQALQNMFNCL